VSADHTPDLAGPGGSGGPGVPYYSPGSPQYGVQPPLGVRPPHTPATSTTGPKVTVLIGSLLVIGAIVLAVFAVLAVVRVVPTDMMRFDGSPGEAVLGVVEAPGHDEVTLDGDTSYALYLVRTDDYRTMALSGSIEVTGPDGEPVDVRGPGTNLYVHMGSVRAQAVAAFDADRPGTYRIACPPAADGSPAQIWVADYQGAEGLVAGIFSGVAGIFGAVFLGIAGLTMVATGAILWGVRRGNARKLGLR
jgi:hypothetical protein